MMETEKRYEEVSKVFKAKLIKKISSMSLQEMKKEMQLWDTANIETFCENYGAIENENYEVCQAAKEVLNERKENEK
jgi:hypothetical protein